MKKLLMLLLIATLSLTCLVTGCNKKELPAETTPEATTPKETVATDPEETSSVEPEVTSTNPEETSSVEPEVTSTNPEETSSVDPEVTSTDPEETSSVEPEVTSANPEETSSIDPEVTEPATSAPDDPVTPPEPITELKLTAVNVTNGEDTAEIYAGAELMAYLQKKGIPNTAAGFPISVVIDSSLEMDSFKIEASLNENVGMTIRGGNGRGVIYGVYRFLEKYAGFRYLAPGLETQTEDDVIIPDGVVMEHSPQILSRRMNWRSVSGQIDWMLKNGINNPTISAELGGDYLNYGSLGVHTIGRLSGTTYPYPDYTSNPCLTDPEVYETVLKNLRAELEKNPHITIASVSQTDVEVWCKCPNCSKIAEEEGSLSGLWIRFVNKIAVELEDEYPDLLIDTLAYKHTQTPPKITKPHKNVCVRLCSIKCCFTHPLSDPNCPEGKKLHDDIIGWGAICDNVHIWDYTTNFHYYISTFANLGALRENMKFYAENNVASMFPQGNSQGQSGEFGELRAYLLAKLMWDPYMSEEEYYGYMDDFLKAYYGEGWQSIRAFIDKTIELAANGGYKINGDESAGSAVCGQGIYGHPLTAITRNEYLENEAYFDELWATALALAGDRAEYVERSMLQWRLTKLYLHPNAEEAQKLIDDAKAWGVVWKEGQLNVLPESDLSKSPYYWVFG